MFRLPTSTHAPRGHPSVPHEFTPARSPRSSLGVLPLPRPFPLPLQLPHSTPSSSPAVTPLTDSGFPTAHSPSQPDFPPRPAGLAYRPCEFNHAQPHSSIQFTCRFPLNLPAIFPCRPNETPTLPPNRPRRLPPPF